jgi:hypothetical protein
MLLFESTIYNSFDVVGRTEKMSSKDRKRGELAPDNYFIPDASKSDSLAIFYRLLETTKSLDFISIGVGH